MPAFVCACVRAHVCVRVCMCVSTVWASCMCACVHRAITCKPSSQSSKTAFLTWLQLAGIPRPHDGNCYVPVPNGTEPVDYYSWDVFVSFIVRHTPQRVALCTKVLLYSAYFLNHVDGCPHIELLYRITAMLNNRAQSMHEHSYKGLSSRVLS